ncbi:MULTISPECIES: hypothetical protein [Paraburkholderia]|uniref:hypothetical protein n=1 Tax=Paraburkholderia TaxID=1822464 RepID=UPI0038BCF04E
MGIANAIGKELMKIVWKVLAPMLVALLEKGLKFIFAKVEDLYARTMDRRRDEANTKAAEAHEKSVAAADDPIEAARQRGREEVWKEIADHYAVDTAQLKAELIRLKAQAESKGIESLDEIPAQQLPALASPTVTRDIVESMRSLEKE